MRRGKLNVFGICCTAKKRTYFFLSVSPLHSFSDLLPCCVPSSGCFALALSLSLSLSLILSMFVSPPPPRLLLFVVARFVVVFFFFSLSLFFHSPIHPASCLIFLSVDVFLEYLMGVNGSRKSPSQLSQSVATASSSRRPVGATRVF